MARLKRKEGKLTSADLASYGILPKQPDGPKPVKSQESETLDGAAERSDRCSHELDWFVFPAGELRGRPFERSTVVWRKPDAPPARHCTHDPGQCMSVMAI
jgi:hypothetical protein